MAGCCVLNKQSVKKLVKEWLDAEGKINLVGFALSEDRCSASIRMGAPGVLAGSPFVEALYNEYDCSVIWNAHDGDAIESSDFSIATVTGAISDLIFCERLAVSLLSRASGIASLARKMRKVLGDLPWKGDLRVPHTLTPGFELVEEYAMLLGGVVSNNTPIFVRQCHAVVSGGIDKAVELIRSKVGLGPKIEVECNTLTEALSAAVAGANLISFQGLSSKDLSAFSSKLKTSHPQIQVQLNADFDETNLKPYALSGVDFLATSKLSNGYVSLDFKVTYSDSVDGIAETKCIGKVVVQSASDQVKLQSPGPAPVDEISSPTASAAKKSRLDDSQSDNSKAPSKPNGTPARNANMASSNTPKESNQKRSQRNQRHQQHNTPRQSAQRTQSPGGMQLLQMTPPRFVSPNSPSTRPLGSQGQGNTGSMSNTMNQQNQSNMGMRLSNQQMQRLGTGMLGSGPNVSSGFLNMQQSPSQHNFPMLGGTGPMMGGVGLGMRMGGPGSGMMNCRSCGVTNAPGLPFCRNCRAPLR